MIKIIVKYGIAPRHVIRFIPVTRATASSWLNGKSKPADDKTPLLQRFINAIRTAEKYGELPVPAIYKGRARDTYIVDLLGKYLVGPGRALARQL